MMQGVAHLFLENRIPFESLLCLGWCVFGFFMSLEAAVVSIVVDFRVIRRVHISFCSESLSDSLILWVLTLLGPQSVSLSAEIATKGWQLCLSVTQSMIHLQLFTSGVSRLRQGLPWIIRWGHELWFESKVLDQSFEVELFWWCLIHMLPSASYNRFKGCSFSAVEIHGFTKLFDSCSCNGHCYFIVFDNFIHSCP